jgi:hypothetical protein
MSYFSANIKKPHAIGETLLLPAAIKICQIMHGEDYSQALEAFLFLIIP